MGDALLNVCISEAAGLSKVCDAYCICTLQPSGPGPDPKSMISPRGKPNSSQVTKTETSKKTDVPKWKAGVGQYQVSGLKPEACLELAVIANRMLGSVLLGRAHVELAALLSESKTDRWYSLKDKRNADAGSVRLLTAYEGAPQKDLFNANHGSRENSFRANGRGPNAIPRGAGTTPSPEQAPHSRYFGDERQRPPSNQNNDLNASPIVPDSILPPAPSGAGRGTLFGKGRTPRPSNSRGTPLPPGAARASWSDINLTPRTTPEAPPPAPISQAQGTFQYKIGDMVGRGAFGKVFQAMNLMTGELMAVKCVDLNNISKEELEEIKNEVTLLRTLRNRHVVSYIGTHTMETSFNILMEFCPGGSVSTLLKAFGAFPEPVLAQYTRQCFEGLSYIHSHAVMHRDIKGANILVAANGVLKIADFGASAQLRGTVTENADTASMRGTPFWMAPEVIKQERYGRSADCWSMGMTVIEMATANHPWAKATNKFSLMYEIASTDHLPEIPEDISAECRDFILRCINRNVEARMSADQALQHAFLVNVVPHIPVNY